MTRATAPFQLKIMPSLWWMRWSRDATPSSASLLATDQIMEPIDELKRAAAEAAVGLVENGMIVGLGTGSTAKLAVEALARRVKDGLRIVGVPTSEVTARQAQSAGI